MKVLRVRCCPGDTGKEHMQQYLMSFSPSSPELLPGSVLQGGHGRLVLAFSVASEHAHGARGWVPAQLLCPAEATVGLEGRRGLAQHRVPKAASKGAEPGASGRPARGPCGSLTQPLLQRSGVSRCRGGSTLWGAALSKCFREPDQLCTLAPELLALASPGPQTLPDLTGPSGRLQTHSPMWLGENFQNDHHAALSSAEPQLSTGLVHQLSQGLSGRLSLLPWTLPNTRVSAPLALDPGSSGQRVC